MNQSPDTPAIASRTQKTFSALARLLLWGVSTVVGLFALTLGLLHFWIVPRAAEWRPELERWATEAVGVPVTIGHIHAQSRDEPGANASLRWRLVPVLVFSDVRLADRQGRQALHLAQVRAAISVTSLWRLGFEQLLIDAPELDVRRSADGRIEVAGIDFSGPQSQDSRAADWFFSQSEFVIRQGTVRWTDELRGQAPLLLTGLDFVSRNGLREHRLRLDATPPPAWGQRLSLMAELREPLLDLRSPEPGQQPWYNWSGQLYADLPQASVERLKAYADLSEWGIDVRSGRGRMRAWSDLERGRITAVTADLALADVDVRLAPQLPELALQSVQGRVSASWNDAGFTLATEPLGFRTRDGREWPASRLRIRHDKGPSGGTSVTELTGERVDLAALSALAASVPLPDTARQWMGSLRPAGQLLDLNARWEAPTPAPDAPADAPAPAPTAYSARGRAVDLALAGAPSGRMSSSGDYPLPGRPGLSGAAAEFELDQNGGRVQLDILQGSLELPGVFEEAVIPLNRLQAQMRWALQGERIDVWLDPFVLDNADAAGTAKAHWHTADPARSRGASRFPGVLDLQATLTRADATRVHRYMPLTTGEDARRYVREAVKGGHSDKVDFRVRGDLWDVPFGEPGTDGEFRIAARLHGVDFDYVPAFLRDSGDKPWPALQGVDGQLLLLGNDLWLSGLQGGIDGLPRVRVSEGDVRIPDLASDDPVLTVGLRTEGAAAETLDYVRRSPVDSLLSGALARASASGNAALDLRLALPLSRLRETTVQGQVQLAGTDLRITPESPMLEASRGSVHFTEKGFRLQDTRARIYGGEASVEGGMVEDARGPSRIEFRANGQVTAEGLRDGGLGFVSRLFGHASGATAYTARLGFRGGAPEISVSSSLQGMALSLPAPLSKPADASLPLRYDNAVASTANGPDGEQARTDRLAVDIGPAAQPLLTLQYERDVTATEPRVLRGSIGLGLPAGEGAPLPAQGVLVNARLGRVDADAWQSVLQPESGTDAAPIAGAAEGDNSYLPTRLKARADELVVGRRSFRNVLLDGEREDSLWRANVQAAELDGHIEYRQTGAGSVFARLSRLDLPRSAAEDVEQLLQQPTSAPALDIVVEDLVISGRKLGLVSVQAENRGSGKDREWLLKRLNVRVPEARLLASGRWGVATEGTGGPNVARLDFRLDIDDAGQLLARFGRAGLVRGGRGSIEGVIGWNGSPFSPDYPSLNGELSASVERGQFLKVEPGAAKLLGVLNLQALPRRLTLDFRDVFSDGFTFDFIRGDAKVRQGVATTNNLQMKGINAAVLMEGSADIVREQQDLNVVVVPDLNAGTASLIATAINPAIGLGTFLAQFLLRAPLESATTQQFHISGSWADPKVEKLDKVPLTPAAPMQ